MSTEYSYEYTMRQCEKGCETAYCAVSESKKRMKECELGGVSSVSAFPSSFPPSEELSEAARSDAATWTGEERRVQRGRAEVEQIL